MAYRGYYEAPKLVPHVTGLLSVASVMNHTAKDYDERWVRGFAYEFNSEPTVRLLTVNDDTVTNGTLFDASGRAQYLDYDPFFIEVDDTRSTLGIIGEDRFAIALMQLEGSTQKAVERELWAGSAALAASSSNSFLSKTGGATVLSSGNAHAPEVALALLEQSLSDSPYGGCGVIHMTADVASTLNTRLEYISAKDSPSGLAYVRTRVGTAVSIGYGYTGNGPIGTANAAASATNKWIYGTGPVDVHLSESQVVNDNLGQGIGASVNDMKIKAVRSAAVYFDPSVHTTVRIAVPNN